MKRSLDRLYHATSLHYVPAIVAAGALYPKSIAKSAGIAPRSTAVRRDTMLGLTDYVHLSPACPTPLLSDKVRKGFPHAVLIFDGGWVLSLPETAVLPYNTKAWRTRAAYAPVVDESERRAILRRYLTTGKMPSLEVLVKYGLPLDCLTAIAFAADMERRIVLDLLLDLRMIAPEVVVDPSLFTQDHVYMARSLQLVEEYFEKCRSAGSVLTPPSLEFD